MSYTGVGQPFGFGQEDVCCDAACEAPCAMTTGANCGSLFGTQFMLSVIGRYSGELNGNSTPETQAAIATYGASKGIPVNPLSPSGPFCAALMADYDAHMASGQPATAGCPAGQVGVPPFCFAAVPSGAAPPPPPPGAPPPAQQPSVPPPSVPPPAEPPTSPPPTTPLKAETIFGLPPVAVYVGLGALGLLAVTAIAKKRAA